MVNNKTLDNGFEILEIDNEVATAKIALQGAHLFDYTRYGEPKRLWLSSQAFFEPGKAIRGGIPICWPWFGKLPEHRDWPQHGFARTAMWSVHDISEQDGQHTAVTLTLNHKTVQQAYFPYAFRLFMKITVGEKLTVSLTTENHDTVAFPLSEALHTYFNIGNIAGVSLIGLEGITYADATDGFRKKFSEAPIGIYQETDRVYINTLDTIILQDQRLGRNLVIGKSGSRSTVVWNPWNEKAAGMADFEDEGYKEMVCVETANALDNAIMLPPKKAHTITQTVQ